MDLIYKITSKFKRFQKTKIKALYEDEFIKALKRLGVYNDINEGKEKCVYCDEKITIEDIQGIILREDKPLFICSDLRCLDKHNKNARNN